MLFRSLKGVTCEFCGNLTKISGRKYGGFTACPKCYSRRNAALLEAVKCASCDKKTHHARQTMVYGELGVMCVECFEESKEPF